MHTPKYTNTAIAPFSHADNFEMLISGPRSISVCSEKLLRDCRRVVPRRVEDIGEATAMFYKVIAII